MADVALSPLTSDNLPEESTVIEGDTKTIVSYELQDEKIKKVSLSKKLPVH